MLSGCAGQGARPEAAGAWLEQRAAAFAEIGQWRAHGRMAISDGERGGSAGFVLNDNLADELRLNLSVTGARWRLLAGPDGAELEGSRTPTRYASQPEPLVEEALGWYLPVSLMRDWIRGLPAPAGARLVFDEAGTLAALEHRQWLIEYQRYRQEGDLQLPQRIVATSGPYQVKLVILGWKLGGAVEE
ncbi:MAG: lipoprotein insertase outer membrane protein LolB [Wenzhouxiangellaceae bacterium]